MNTIIRLPYPGELRDLVNELDGTRQFVAHTLGTDHPVFVAINDALTGGCRLVPLRRAKALWDAMPADERRQVYEWLEKVV